MEQLRPVALSIAGLDPSAGAGLLADVKTFEAHRVYGLGVASAITYQHDQTFRKVEWIVPEKIIEQLILLNERFNIRYVKIGLIENFVVLNQLISYMVSCFHKPVIIWDPVLKASAGYEFHKQIDLKLLEQICQHLFMVTPNLPEAGLLGDTGNAIENAKTLSKHCIVYLKGGHADQKKGKDTVFLTNGKTVSYNSKVSNATDKHGSGCVLAAAIAANLARNNNLHRTCLKAKNYTAGFLQSNKTMLGYHKI